MELTMTGRIVDGDRARDLGLVNHVFPTDEFEDRADEIVAEIANGPPIALKHIKELIRTSHETSLDDALANEATRQTIVFETEDYQRAVEALRNGEEPEFRGSNGHSRPAGTQLATVERGVAVLAERLDAFPVVPRATGEVLGLRFPLDDVPDRTVVRSVDVANGVVQRDRRSGGDPSIRSAASSSNSSVGYAWLISSISSASSPVIVSPVSASSFATYGPTARVTNSDVA